MAIYTSACHCGDLSMKNQNGLAPANWPLREYQCSLCRKHAMLSTSDPNGEIVLQVRDPASLRRYRFATGVTDFLICAHCGAYVGATIMDDGRMMLNGRLMDCASELLARTAEPKSLEDQSAD